MLIREIMTETVKTIPASATVREAARLMAAEDCGVLPVSKDDRLIGMVTDRDIALRGVAEGKNPDTCSVEEIMSGEVKYLFDDETTEALARNFGTLQIRRLPVVDRAKRLVGIVSLGDLATRCNDANAGAALKSVSEQADREAPLAG
jgi:CBS domain-containing protein